MAVEFAQSQTKENLMRAFAGKVRRETVTQSRQRKPVGKVLRA